MKISLDFKLMTSMVTRYDSKGNLGIYVFTPKNGPKKSQKSSCWTFDFSLFVYEIFKELA